MCRMNTRSDHREMPTDESTVIWFHDENFAFDIQRAIHVKLNSIFKRVKTITDQEEVKRYLSKEFIEPNLQLIMSSVHTEELCRFIEGKSETFNIYELDTTLTQSIRKSSNTWITFSSIKDLFRALDEDFERCRVTQGENEAEDDRIYKTCLPFNIFDSLSIPPSLHFFDKEASTCLLFQLLNKIIVRMTYTNKELQIMCAFCRQRYMGNEVYMRKIFTFQEKYRSDEAIKYYTEYVFLFQLLTEVFQREDTDGINKFRRYIADLHQQLEQRYTPPDDDTMLFRGKTLPLVTLQRLKDLKERSAERDTLICMNGFLSATRDREVAKSFAGIDGTRDGYGPTIFILNINKAMETRIVYSDITTISLIFDENEVLFSMGSVWKLLEIKNENDLWLIELELSNGLDDQLKRFDEQFFNDHPFLRESSNDYYIFLFAKILYELGIYSQAKEFYDCLLAKKQLSNKFKGLVHFNLATMQNEQGHFSDARIHLQEALKLNIFQRTPVGSNHEDTTIPSQMIIWNTVGLLYQKKDEFEEARRSFKAALHKPGSDIDKAHVYNSLGVLGMMLGEINEETHGHLREAAQLAGNNVCSHRFRQDLEDMERQL